MSRKVSQMDLHQIVQHQHDEAQGAQRVTIVDANIGDAIKEAFAKLELPKLEINHDASMTAPAPQIIHVDRVIKEAQPIEIQKVIHTKEYEKIEIEKPIIITEIRIVEIEKPVIVKEIEQIRIETPIIIKEIEKLPSYLKYCLIALIMIQFISLVKNLIH